MTTIVDLERYYGKWYEIARLPTWFQGDFSWSPRFVSEAEAFYSPPEKNNLIKVENTAKWQWKSSVLNFLLPKSETVTGYASVLGPNSFRVSFNPFTDFFGLLRAFPNYYVRELYEDVIGDDYLFSIVTSSDSIVKQKNAWLLSRVDPYNMNTVQKTLARVALKKMEFYGVDLDKLIKSKIFD